MASKFNEEIADRLIALFVGGATLNDASREVGLSSQTVNHWLKRGRKEPDGLYGRFAAGVDAGRAASKAVEGPMDELELAVVVSRAARKGSVQAMKLRDDMLERERLRNAESEATVKKDPLGFMDDGRLRVVA